MANYAYYALHKLNIRPCEWLDMDEQEKAFIIASIQIRIEKEKKEQKEIERKSKRGK